MPKISEMRIDIGATRKENADSKVKVGDLAAFVTAYEEFGDVAVGKAFDNRAGCAALVELLRGERYPFDLVAVFSVQEEVGLRGAEGGRFRRRAGPGPDPGVHAGLRPAQQAGREPQRGPGKRAVDLRHGLAHHPGSAAGEPHHADRGGRGNSLFRFGSRRRRDQRRRVSARPGGDLPRRRSPAWAGTRTRQPRRSTGSDYDNVVRLVDAALRAAFARKQLASFQGWRHGRVTRSLDSRHSGQSGE